MVFSMAFWVGFRCAFRGFIHRTSLMGGAGQGQSQGSGPELQHELLVDLQMHTTTMPVHRPACLPVLSIQPVLPREPPLCTADADFWIISSSAGPSAGPRPIVPCDQADLHMILLMEIPPLVLAFVNNFKHHLTMEGHRDVGLL